MIKNEKLPLGIRFLLYLASGFLGILLFVAVLVTSLVADFRIVFAKDTIRDTVREVVTDILSAPQQVRVKAPVTTGNGGLRVAPRPERTLAMIRRDEVTDVASDLTDQLIEIFYETVGNEFEEEIPFTVDEFKEMINESTVKDYIADKTSGLVADYFAGEVTTTFQTQEVLDLIDENSELIESITGEPLPEDVSNKLADIFDNSEIIKTLEVDGLAGFMEKTGEQIPVLSDSPIASFDLQGTLQMLRDATSTTNLIIAIAICVLLMVAIILVNLHQFSKGLRRAGYPLILVGLGIFPCILADSIFGLLDGIPGAAALSKLVSQFTVVYGVILGIGVALFIAGIVFIFVLRNKGTIYIFRKKPADPIAEEIPVVETPSEEIPAEEAPAESPLFTEEEVSPVIE